MITMSRPDCHKIIADAAHVGFADNDVCLCRIEIWEGEENLMGGVIYTGYTGEGGSVSMHVAGFQAHWCNPSLLYMMFDYPFNCMKVKKVFTQVPSFETKILDFNKKVGLSEVCRVADAFPSGDMVVLGMTRDQCRFLRRKPKWAK